MGRKGIAQDAKTQRKQRLQREERYGENTAGKWVRSSAFREIDYDPNDPTRLREFDSFDEAFAFDEECRLNNTGGRKALYLSKPKDTVPKEQLALEKAITHVVRKEGNETRVALQHVDEGLHNRHDETQQLLKEVNAKLDAKRSKGKERADDDQFSEDEEQAAQTKATSAEPAPHQLPGTAAPSPPVQVQPVKSGQSSEDEEDTRAPSDAASGRSIAPHPEGEMSRQHLDFARDPAQLAQQPAAQPATSPIAEIHREPIDTAEIEKEPVVLNDDKMRRKKGGSVRQLIASRNQIAKELAETKSELKKTKAKLRKAMCYIHTFSLEVINTDSPYSCDEEVKKEDATSPICSQLKGKSFTSSSYSDDETETVGETVGESVVAVDETVAATENDKDAQISPWLRKRLSLKQSTVDRKKRRLVKSEPPSSSSSSSSSSASSSSASSSSSSDNKEEESSSSDASDDEK